MTCTRPFLNAWLPCASVAAAASPACHCIHKPSQTILTTPNNTAQYRTTLYQNLLHRRTTRVRSSLPSSSSSGMSMISAAWVRSSYLERARTWGGGPKGRKGHTRTVDDFDYGICKVDAVPQCACREQQYMWDTAIDAHASVTLYLTFSSSSSDC